MGKKEKLKLGLKLGKESKRIPLKYGYICVGFLRLLSQLTPDARPLRLLKMIYNTERIGTDRVRVLTFGLTPNVNTLSNVNTLTL